MLGSRIALCRRAQGLSQSELADKLNISPSAIGMYEQGRREPSCDILIALSRVLGVSVDYLLTGSHAPQQDGAFSMPFQPQNMVFSAQQMASFTRDELIILITALLMTDKNS